MATLKLPDGRTITFPDGLAPDQVKKIVDAAKAAPPAAPEQSTMQTVDNRVRAVARGVPIIGGAMDEISAGLNTGFGFMGDYGAAVKQERDRDKAYDAENPWESTGLQVMGGIGGAATVAKGLGAHSMPKTLPGKVGAGAGGGGLLGGIEAFTRAEGGFGERWDAAKKAAGPGALIGGAFPIVGYGVGKAIDAFRKPAASGLSSSILKEQAGPLFDRARQANMALKPEAYDKMVGRIYQSLGNDFVPENMPQLQNALNALEKRRGQPLPYSEIMNLREVLKSAYRTDNPNQTRLMMKAVDTLDELVEGLNPNVLIGDADPQMVSAIHAEARDLWRRGKNAELLETMVENAKNAVGANYTEAGFQTAMKQQLRAVAKDNFKRYAWLKPAERQAILNVIRAEGAENFLRKLGKYSVFTGGGMMKTGIATGAATALGGPGAGTAVAALLGAGGTVARPLSNQITKRNTALLGETLLQGADVIPSATAEELARLGLIYGAPAAGRAGAPVAGLLGGGGW
jgi:hypothetical protein